MKFADTGPRKGFIRKFGQNGPHFRRLPVLIPGTVESEDQLKEMGFLRAALRKEMHANPNYVWHWMAPDDY